MPADLPCPVLVSFGIGSAYDPKPSLGLLLEWRQVADDRHVGAWEGLVLWADRPANATTWEARLRWVASRHLTRISNSPGVR